MWLLTGPPRIAGITRRYAAVDLWCECAWDDSESVWHEYDDGRRELYRAAYRLRGRYGVRAASEDEAFALVSDLQGTFAVVPRTRLAGDPDWAEEHEVSCRRTSALPATTLLANQDPVTGRPVWAASADFEGVTVYDAPPGLSVGHFRLDSPGGQRTLYAEDGATMTRDDGQAVVLRDGTPLTIHTLSLGPAPTVARYAKRDGTLILLQTRD